MHSIETPACAVDPIAIEKEAAAIGALLAGFLFDAFRVFGNLCNALMLLGFFQQPGFDCLSRGGRG
jgi:hypothetical protein